MTKKITSLLAVLIIAVSLFSVSVFAAKNEPEFSFQLSSSEKQSIEASTGDIITVTLRLKRTDSDDPYTMHSFQDEILYDSEFFEPVESSALLMDGIVSNDTARADRLRAWYVNYLSMHGGNLWDAETKPATMQFKVIGESGVSKLENSNVLVSLPDGSGSYLCEVEDLTVIVTTDCRIRFMTRGGSEIDDVIAQYGEKLKRPDDPTREGYTFAGWYREIELLNEWDFDNDVVEGNMSLYAKWVEGVPEVTPEPDQPTKGFPWWIFLLLLLIAVALYFWKKYNEKNNS